MKRTKPGMSPFWDCIGMRETVMKEGYAEIEIDITSNLHQSRGTVHGGVLASLINAAIGLAVRSYFVGGSSFSNSRNENELFPPSVCETFDSKSKIKSSRKDTCCRYS
jgi:acyl-coenzyme A thioesterase PaaI-like protein